MKPTTLALTSIAALALALSACEGIKRAAEKPQTATAVASSEAMRHRAASVEAGAQAKERLSSLGYIGRAADSSKAAASSGLDTLAAQQRDRYLIRNATFTAETDDARAATEELVAATQEAGGYVADLREHVDALGRRSVTLQIRVPASQFESTMLGLDALGKILEKQVSTEDVTEQFVDTEARARNLKRTEERLLEHLERTGKLEDVVKVERELTRIREEIERLEGRLRYLSHRTAFSTLTITLREKPKAEPVLPATTFSSAQTASEALRALVSLLQAVWARFIWIGVWSALWLPAAVLVWVAYRRHRNQGQARSVGSDR